MGDSEPMVAETSVAEPYPLDGYNNTASNPVPETGATAVTGVAGEANSSYELPYSGDGSVYAAGGPDSVQQAEFSAVNESKQDIGMPDANDAAGVVGMEATDSGIVSGDHSSVNGGVDASGLENGNASENVDGSADDKQLTDAYAAVLSAEEDRLWNIVTANSSDFTAWTSLIEETEKVAESNILKIRRVYDAFLAEFPLCYGYWKKYADHEARLSSADKVVEIYERAVQGVTYSVDMWLHYCIFAISTYGDSDTVRRYLLIFIIICLMQGGSLYPYLRGLSIPYGIVKLYERCVIACANYPEYWIRYVLCMEASESMDLANNVLARASQVFVKRQPEIHIFCARFKEQAGDIVGARAAYHLVHTEISPGLLEAIIRHANMEHRLGKLEDAFSLYEQAIAIEKGKEHSQTLPMLFAQYSRFVYLASGNAEKAKEILVGGLENGSLSKALLEALLHFEAIQPQPKQVDIDFLESLVVKFIMPNPENPGVASATEREELSIIFLEFLNLFGDVQSIKRGEDRHAKLFLPHRSMSELKKRHAEDFLASDKTKVSRAYSALSPAHSVTGAYPNAPNQWTNYGAQPQTWPATTQGQQWPAGYTQPASYGAYAGYGGNYANPQVPAPVPQSTAYGAYPPAYPAQALPQQNYAQPAAPAQQPAAVPQAYYGSYY